MGRSLVDRLNGVMSYKQDEYDRVEHERRRTRVKIEGKYAAG